MPEYPWKNNTALIAGATRAASRLLEQNQTDKIKADLSVKSCLIITKKEKRDRRWKLKSNFMKKTTGYYNLPMKR
jgi:hypothetical protein